MTHRSDNVKKGWCLKAIDKDINLSLGEDFPMGDVVDTTNIVLVGRVRG